MAERDKEDRVKYEAVVDEYRKFMETTDEPSKRRKVADSKTTPEPGAPAVTSAKRPFKEVVKDHHLMALVNDKDGDMNPLVTKSYLTELVTPPSHVIKCMDEFSKDIISKCITNISNAWEGLNLKLIPAEEIPMRPRAYDGHTCLILAIPEDAKVKVFRSTKSGIMKLTPMFLYPEELDWKFPLLSGKSSDWD
ncbi:hypothetical protein FF38_03731 [Lucilia cuprina]|uniref:Uncharacterized protein n=1 Tax=Lucilia cuprina TaxID=7375 RepID=A0A0L0C018_LUCCU|nr:hypothetical protein FF38_03731 [Lucilia cuprina]